MNDPARSPTRKLRLFLRDFRMLEAHLHLAEGQSLRSYLAHRTVYVNLRDARWASTGQVVRHAVLKVEQVLWAAAPEGDVPVVEASIPREPRAMEFQLDGGLLIRAGLCMGDSQRLSDYLESAGPFIALHDARLLQSGRPPRAVNVTLGDIVLNQEAIQAIWEAEDGLPAGEPGDGDAEAALEEEGVGRDEGDDPMPFLELDQGP